MADRLITIVGFTVMGICLLLIGYQTVLLSRMLHEIAALVARTH